MTRIFAGTIEQRWARLDKIGRRCDANSRRCTHKADWHYDIEILNSNGIVTETTTRKACGKHQVVFEKSGYMRATNKTSLQEN